MIIIKIFPQILTTKKKLKSNKIEITNFKIIRFRIIHLKILSYNSNKDKKNNKFSIVILIIKN